MRRRLLVKPACALVSAGLLAVAIAPVAPNASAATPGTEAPGTEAPATGAPPAGVAPQQFAVGVRVLRLVDTSRTIHLPGGRTEPRTLVTYVRYPALGAVAGSVGSSAVRDAPPASSAGPFPLIVFGHGFAVTPSLYTRLLDAWARAGFVVAAPVFPLANANAPGGPDESDIVNQPRDMSFVISSLLAQDTAAGNPFAGLIDPSEVAVAGQSDGGVTALAVADSRRTRDPRVRAAVILSGAEMSGVGGYSFLGGPPLLAAQGTADTSNEPRYTYEYFRAARRPKYLLRLLGAQHLPPYTREEPQLSIVERASVAFLDGYLKPQRTPSALAQLLSFGNVPNIAALTSEP